MVGAIITMTAVAAAVTGWAQPTAAEQLEGEATFYAQGMMSRVAVNRGLIDFPGDLARWLRMEGAVGAVALNRAGDLYRHVWIDGPLGIEGPFVAIDCSQREHYEDREARGRVVEVDWVTKERWGMAGPVAVRVWFRDPRRASVNVPLPL